MSAITVKHPSPDQCTACTTCTAYCPVSRATRNFRGPKMTGPAFERFRLLHQAEELSLSYCANCKNCDISCPNGVPVSKFNMLARAEYCKINRPPLRDWFVSHGELLYSLVKLFPAGLANFGMNNPLTRAILDVVGIHKRAPLPSFARRSFKSFFRKYKQAEGLKKSVVYFPGCYTNMYSPVIGKDAVALLNSAGYEVIVPDGFVCCGLPLFSNGFVEDAEKNSVKNLEELNTASRSGLPVLTTCPSCALSLKELAEEAGSDVYIADSSEFFAELLDSGELKSDFKAPKELNLIYHAPCHLRAQGIGRTGFNLLKRLPNVKLKDADAGCCGISGSYGFKKDKYRVARTVGQDLANTVLADIYDYVLTECGTCQVQINHMTDRQVTHPLSLLKSLM